MAVSTVFCKYFYFEAPSTTFTAKLSEKLIFTLYSFPERKIEL